eukprot:TRINITY_DN59958_c0_g1_i1.p1 TRINITY_DN59958_c0_g1~~TRINITY_DN59958_c0_g1_i1.p1  ORF type:complete len:607 (+),score=293.96 TRINITY_DN59958_c0_g1_i1:123-1823(+)
METAGLGPEEAAAKWGFTVEELEAALKVVGILRFKPEVFLEDIPLRTTGLWRWINRPPSMNKQAGKRVQQELFKHARNQRRRLMKEQDKKKLAKTEMRVARDEALERLLTIDPDQQRALLIENEKGCQLQVTGSPEPDTKMIEAGKDPSAAVLIPSGAGGSVTEVKGGDEVQESPGELHASRKCHICKEAFTELHHFYYSLCKDCGVFNYSKRLQRRDLKGKVILLTGSRIKIGYQVALKMLNDGATVIATTRFPQDAAKRFQQEENYAEWKDRLHLHALDLRDLWSVKQFCRYMLQNVKSLFGIVHNAAQTIARPTEYYQHLIEGEGTRMETPLIAPAWQDFVSKGGSSFQTGIQHRLEHKAAADEAQPQKSNTTRITDAGTEMVTVNKPFYDMYDSMQEAQDRRTQNSWTSNLSEVSAEEAAEVHAINALSPFIINSMLKPILCARPEGADDEKHFVINVSAMEGQFYRFKSTTHPHTNMAKASLNMMTRTSGRDYAQDRVYMNSVDTGWITDESPYEKQQRRLASQQLCPLDEIDAAARVLDLMYTDSSEHSKFWKDYHTIPW